MAAEIETVTGRARIVGINIPFWDLVVLLVKLSLAAIPAVIILAILWGIIGAFFVGLFTGGTHGH